MGLIGLIACLLAIFLQDWKYRHIHIVLPAALFILSLYTVKGFTSISWTIIAYNILFFIIVIGILTLYMSIKSNRFLNPFKNYFGLGDLLFYIAVTPLFFLRNYVIFFILSLLFSIMLQLMLGKRMRASTVPLAGFSSVFLTLLILIDCFQDTYSITLL